MEMVDKATEKRWKRKMGRLLWTRRLYSPWFFLVYYWFWRTLFRFCWLGGVRRRTPVLTGCIFLFFLYFFLVSVGEAFIPEKQLSGRRKEAGDRRKPSGFRGWQPGKARGNALVPYERRTGVAVLKGAPLPLGGHGGMAGKEERVVPDEADSAGTAGRAFLEAAGGRMFGSDNASGLRRGGLDGDAL